MRADVTSRTLPSSSGPYMLACLSISQPISHLLQRLLHLTLLHTSLADLTSGHISVQNYTNFLPVAESMHPPSCKKYVRPPEKLNYFTVRSFLGCEYDPHFTLTSSLLLHPSPSSLHASLFLIYSQKKNNCIWFRVSVHGHQQQNRLLPFTWVFFPTAAGHSLSLEMALVRILLVQYGMLSCLPELLKTTDFNNAIFARNIVGPVVRRQ